jgi:hypothetical protein
MILLIIYIRVTGQNAGNRAFVTPDEGIINRNPAKRLLKAGFVSKAPIMSQGTVDNYSGDSVFAPGMDKWLRDSTLAAHRGGVGTGASGVNDSDPRKGELRDQIGGLFKGYQPVVNADGTHTVVIVGYQMVLQPIQMGSAGVGVGYSVEECIKQLYPDYSRSDKPVMNFEGEDDIMATEIVFSNATTWAGRDIRVPTRQVARDIGALPIDGVPGCDWYTVEPQFKVGMPQSAEAIFTDAQMIHPLFRLRGFPQLLQYRALNNLMTLLYLDPEYFFNPVVLGAGVADAMMIAYRLDRALPGLLIDLEADIPIIYHPGAANERIGIQIDINRQDARILFNSLLAYVPIAFEAPPHAVTLDDLSDTDTVFAKSSEVAEMMRRAGIKRSCIQQVFCEGGVDLSSVVQQLPPAVAQEILLTMNNRVTEEDIIRDVSGLWNMWEQGVEQGRGVLDENLARVLQEEEWTRQMTGGQRLGESSDFAVRNHTQTGVGAGMGGGGGGRVGEGAGAGAGAAAIAPLHPRAAPAVGVQGQLRGQGQSQLQGQLRDQLRDQLQGQVQGQRQGQLRGQLQDQSLYVGPVLLGDSSHRQDYKQPESLSPSDLAASPALAQQGYDSLKLTFPSFRKRGKAEEEEGEEEDEEMDLHGGILDGSGRCGTGASGSSTGHPTTTGTTTASTALAPLTAPPIVTQAQAVQFIDNFVVNQAQPREEPPETLERRQNRDALESGVNAYMGRTITLKEAEYGGDDNRKKRNVEVDPNMSTKVWHTMSIRPERFFVSQVPRVGMNAYMRRLIQGTGRSFNPMHFVLLPDGMQAIRRRDRYIKSSWPLIKETLVPAVNSNELDVERMAVEQVLMDTCNRLSGSMDALDFGDAEVALSHMKDAYMVALNTLADMEAKRKATETNNDVLVRRRKAISEGIPSTGSTAEVMYQLGKRENAYNTLFHKGVGGRQAQLLQSQPAAGSSSGNQQQQSYTDQYTNSELQGQQPYQQFGQQQGGGGRYRKRRQYNQLPQQYNPLPQQPGAGRARGFIRGLGRGARGGGFPAGGRGASFGRGRGANPGFQQQAINTLPPLPTGNPNSSNSQ